MEFVIIPLFLIVGVAELMLSRSWNTTYFRVGIPIYRKKFNVQPHAGSPPPAAQIQAELSYSFFPKFQVRELDSTSQAFKEGYFAPLSYTPIMHGLLTYKRQETRLVVIGYINWFVLLVIFWLLIAVLINEWLLVPRNKNLSLFESFGFLLLLVPVFGLIYITQALRFRKVGQVAANLWAKGNYQEYRVSYEERRQKIKKIRYILLGLILFVILSLNFFLYNFR